MTALTELEQINPPKGTLLAIGVFDGVHLGHQHLIKRLVQQAAEQDLTSGVITFYRHPRTVLSPETVIHQLTTVEERIALLKRFGVEMVAPLNFDAELAALTAREFVTLLQKQLKMKGLVVGPNFALGHGRRGNAEVLRSLGRQLGFTVEVVPPLLVDSSVASSTAIRKALEHGDLATTARLLGRHFSISGPVVSGAARGQMMGFPTANISLNSNHAVPADGVYATRCHVGDKVHDSVTNIGTNPTFGDGRRSIEVHLLDFKGDIYGRMLTIELVARLRGEVRFAGVDELVAQIRKDVERARAILKQHE